MIQHLPNPIQPQFGHANQPNIESVLGPLSNRITELLYIRRGRLYLLCDESGEKSLPADVYQEFYLCASYDPMRSLQQALHNTCSIEDSSAIVAGALIHNMTLYIVGTEQTNAWIWRSSHLIQLIPNPQGRAIGLPEKGNNKVRNPQPCHEAQRRLYPGDVVILSSLKAGRKISTRLLRQVEAFTTVPESLARALAQFTKSSSEPHPPITVIRLPGTATTPQLPPQSQIDFAYAGAANVTPRTKTSPILVASIIALVAVVLALIVTKPKLPTNILNSFLLGASTTKTIQVATPGAGSPTPDLTPTPYATLTPTT
jgi:hypothetical protein